MEDLAIKKDKRNTGAFFHKIPRLNAKKAQCIASKDISKECIGENSFYDRNYLASEYKLIKMLRTGVELISIENVRQIVPNLF